MSNLIPGENSKDIPLEDDFAAPAPIIRSQGAAEARQMNPEGAFALSIAKRDGFVLIRR